MPKGHFLLGLLALVFTSPIDFPLMLLGGEVWPKKPGADDWDVKGSFYHHGKGYWATRFRCDGEWWSKLSRFLVWWLVFVICVQAVAAAIGFGVK